MILEFKIIQASPFTFALLPFTFWKRQGHAPACPGDAEKLIDRYSGFFHWFCRAPLMMILPIFSSERLVLPAGLGS